MAPTESKLGRGLRGRKSPTRSHARLEKGKKTKVTKSDWESSPLHGWLDTHADEYGFEPLKDEPWHWTYNPAVKAGK